MRAQQQRSSTTQQRDARPRLVLLGLVVVLCNSFACGNDRRPQSIDAAMDSATDSATHDANTDSATHDANTDARVTNDASSDANTRDATADAEERQCDAARCCEPLMTNECQAGFHCAAIDDGCGGNLTCSGACGGSDSCGPQGLCSSARDLCPGSAIALGMYFETTIEDSLDGLADDSHGCGAGDDADAVYHLKAPRDGRVHARLEATGFRPLLYVRQNACNVQVLYSCHAPAPSFPASFTIDVRAGVDYYFVVDSANTPSVGNRYTLDIGYL